MIRQIVKWIVFKLIYPACYHIGAIRPVQSRKIVFVETHSSELSEDFRRIFDALKKEGYKNTVYYLKMSTSAWSRIIIQTCKMLFGLSNASAIFLNESNSAFGAFHIRKGTKLIQLWHACGAFKKWGQSVTDKEFGDDAKNFEAYNGHRNYSLVSVSGDAVCSIYEEAFGLAESNVVKTLGVSRTDCFFDEQAKQEASVKLMELLKQNNVKNRKIVVYMPTFRGSIKDAGSPDRFDVAAFCEKYQSEYMLLVKQHPFVKKPFVIPKKWKGSCIEITNQMTTQELLMTADCLITDYSSVIFEYALMDKPMIFYAYDLEEYYDERGFYYPYEEFVPGKVVKSMDELLQYMANPDKNINGSLEEFRKKYMNGCDGHATERILSFCKR